MNSKEKWKAAKSETGQTRHISPKYILEGDKCYTKYREIAHSINRQFLSQIRKTKENIPPSQINPLDAYRCSIGPNSSIFNIQQISMNDLKKNIITSM